MTEAFRVAKRWVVEGGPLKKPWCPLHVVDCAGKPFAELKTTDSYLSQLCDRPAKQCLQLLKILRHLRNQAVDGVVLEKLKIADPMSSYTKVPPYWRSVLPVDAGLPDTVNVKLPPFRGPDGMPDGCEMTFLFEARRGKPVFMELTPENLTYLRSASVAIDAGNLSAERFGNFPKRRRLSEAARFVRDYDPIVKVDSTRPSLYVFWTTVDGRKARHFRKPASWTAVDVNATQAALRRWRKEHHHVKNSDGAYELECIKSEDDLGSASVHQDGDTDADHVEESCSSGCDTKNPAQEVAEEEYPTMSVAKSQAFKAIERKGNKLCKG